MANRAGGALRRRIKEAVARRARRPGVIRFLIGLAARRKRRRASDGVAAVILDPDGKVLLLEHVFWPEKRWALPGGWIREGEAPEEAVRREIREELGLEVRLERLLAREENGRGRKFAWLCRLPSPTAPIRVSFEVLAARWFSRDEIPEKLIPFHRKAIAALSNLEGGGE